MSNLTEKTVSKEGIFKGHVISLDVETVELPNGAISTRELVSHPGGVAVLAHPALNEDDSTIPPLAKEGLQGVEVYHPAHNEEQTANYRRIAEELGLLITGGSDCHDCRLGEYWTKDETVEKIQALSRNKMW